MSLQIFRNRMQRQRGVRCHYCGEEGLQWRQTKTSGKWRLYALGASRPHVCREYAPRECEDEDDEDEDDES